MFYSYLKKLNGFNETNVTIRPYMQRNPTYAGYFLSNADIEKLYKENFPLGVMMLNQDGYFKHHVNAAAIEKMSLYKPFVYVTIIHDKLRRNSGIFKLTCEKKTKKNVIDILGVKEKKNVE